MKTLLLSLILVIAALAVSKSKGVDREKDILISSVRAFFQMLALGYILKYIFNLDSPFYIIPIFLFMSGFAALTGGKRIGYKSFFFSFVCIALPSALMLVLIVIIQIIPFELNIVIPIAGMAIGNALNAHSLSLDRFRGEVKNNLMLIEGMVALGATCRQALNDISLTAVRTAIIPILNNLKTLGVVFIPGMAAGLLIAGAEPIKAAAYQITIMFVILTVNLMTGLLTVDLIKPRIIELAINSKDEKMKRPKKA